MEYLTNFKKFFKKKEKEKYYYLTLNLEDLRCDPTFNKINLTGRKHVLLYKEIENYLKKLFKFNYRYITNCEKMNIIIGGSLDEMKRVALHYGIDDNKIKEGGNTSVDTGPH